MKTCLSFFSYIWLSSQDDDDDNEAPQAKRKTTFLHRFNYTCILSQDDDDDDDEVPQAKWAEEAKAEDVSSLFLLHTFSLHILSQDDNENDEAQQDKWAEVAAELFLSFSIFSHKLITMMRHHGPSGQRRQRLRAPLDHFLCTLFLTGR